MFVMVNVICFSYRYVIGQCLLLVNVFYRQMLVICKCCLYDDVCCRFMFVRLMFNKKS